MRLWERDAGDDLCLWPVRYGGGSLLRGVLRAEKSRLT